MASPATSEVAYMYLLKEVPNIFKDSGLSKIDWHRDASQRLRGHGLSFWLVIDLLCNFWLSLKDRSVLLCSKTELIHL